MTLIFRLFFVLVAVFFFIVRRCIPLKSGNRKRRWIISQNIHKRIHEFLLFSQKNPTKKRGDCFLRKNAVSDRGYKRNSYRIKAVFIVRKHPRGANNANFCLILHIFSTKKPKILYIEAKKRVMKKPFGYAKKLWINENIRRNFCCFILLKLI